MRKRVPMSLAASTVAIGLSFTAQADVLMWDGGAGDSRIDRTQNWNPDGVPAGANSGVVTGSYATTYYNNQTPADYDIAYGDTSSLAHDGANGDGRLQLTGGTALTFNDSSALQVGEILMLGHLTAGGAAVTLTGNATASVASGMWFGWSAPSGTAYSGSLTLRGNSSLTTDGGMTWRKFADQRSLTHYLTLADSAALTVNNNDVQALNSASLVVNFEQANPSDTPTWTLGEAADFSGANIQYQINGVNTTLSDPRFVLAGNTLSLTVTPKPKLGLFIISSH